MRNRKLVAPREAVLGLLLFGSGIASAKNLLPTNVVPANVTPTNVTRTSLSPMTTQPTVPAPRAQRPQAAYVPGFDYGPRKPVHNRPIAGAQSTIPGAPIY